MTFVENGLGRPHDFGKSRSGAVESPIGGDGEKVYKQPPSTSFIVYNSDKSAGGGATKSAANEKDQEWTRNVADLAGKMDTAGLGHELLDEARKVHAELHPDEQKVVPV